MKKISKRFNKIIENKYFLYVALFLAITTIIGFLLMQNWNAIIFFILIALISSFLTTNMGIILFVSVVGSSLALLKTSGKEGLETQASSSTPSIEPPTSNKAIETNNNSLPSGSTSANTIEESVSSVHKNEKAKSGSSRLDYMNTMEEAYNNLDSMLDGESLGNLTKDTQKLMKTQQELFKTMETMAPMVSQAQDMLKGFNMGDLGNLSKMLGNKK